MPAKIWTVEKIITTLQNLNSIGYDIRPGALHNTHPGLIAAGRKVFGNSREMYKAAGINSYELGSPREWTDEIIIEAIQERHNADLDMSQASVRKVDPGLVLKASRRFKGWYNALDAAGIPSSKFMRQKPFGYWNEKRILDEVLDIHKKGKPLNARYACENYGALFAAANKIFGDWETTMKEAGLDYSKMRAHQGWSEDLVIRRIQDRRAKGLPMSSLVVKKEDSRLWDAARAYYKDWYAALEKAGIPRDSVTKSEKWDPERVINEIKQLASLGEDLSSRKVFFTHSKLYNAGCRYFSTWEQALRIAGYNYEEIRKQRKRFSKEEILQLLRKYQSEGVPLDWTSIREVDASIAKIARERFGSYEAAIEALGLDYNKINRDIMAGKRTWDEERVKAELHSYFAKNESLDLLPKKDPGLYHAAVNYFGDIRKATEAAGMDYQALVSRTVWSEEKIIAEIIKLYGNGEDLSVSHIMQKYGALVRSASAPGYFGSWENAIKAAGLDYDEIRRNWYLEAFKGGLFEKHLKEMFKLLGWRVHYHKRFKFEFETCIPDFYDEDTGIWIDAKLDSWGSGVEASVEKYLRYVDKIIIIHLKGRRRMWKNGAVEFIPIKQFYPELKTPESIVLKNKMELLKRGILQPEEKDNLERFIISIPSEKRDEIIRLVKATP
jgi:hypothetical protein